MRLDPDSEQSEVVDAAVGDTDRLIQTFNALLLIAEAEAGAVREATERVDLPHVIEGVAELYEPLAEEKGLTLEIAPGRSACHSRQCAPHLAGARQSGRQCDQIHTGRGTHQDRGRKIVRKASLFPLPIRAPAFLPPNAPACSSDSCGWKKAAIRRAPDWA